MMEFQHGEALDGMVGGDGVFWGDGVVVIGGDGMVVAEGLWCQNIRTEMSLRSH